MSLDEQIVYLSDIDEDQFGIRTAKSVKVTADNLPKIMEFCHDNNVKMLIARCPADDFPAIHAMEKEGFLLMDTLVYYYSRDLTNAPIPSDTGKATIRQARSGEENEIKVVAAEAFRGYFGHYHADERLDNSKCDEVYISWAVNSCISHDFADEVLVAELNGSVVGLATLRMNSSVESEGVLFGVVQPARKIEVYRSFMIHGMEWSVLKGAKRMVVSTQLINIVVQRVWIRFGFEMRKSYYTLHKWFDSSC